MSNRAGRGLQEGLAGMAGAGGALKRKGPVRDGALGA